MNNSFARSRTTPAELLKQRLGYPVIDTGVPSAERVGDLEDYVATYAGAQLVDRFRAAVRERRRPESSFTSAEAELRPGALCALQESRGVDHSVVLPRNVLDPSLVDDPGQRQLLHRAVNHYHADLWSRFKSQATPVAGVPLRTSREGIVQLEFAVKRLGFKVVAVDAVLDRRARGLPVRAEADRDGALEGAQGEDDDRHLRREQEPFWVRVAELGVAVIARSDVDDGDVDAGSGSVFGDPAEIPFTEPRLVVISGGRYRGACPIVPPALLGFSAAPLPSRFAGDPLYSSRPSNPAAGPARDPLNEAWRLVDEGHLSADAFRAYVFETPYRLFIQANPHFFKGTRVDDTLSAPPPAVAA